MGEYVNPLNTRIEGHPHILYCEGKNCEVKVFFERAEYRAIQVSIDKAPRNTTRDLFVKVAVKCRDCASRDPKWLGTVV